MSRDVMEEIKNEITQNKIVVYMKGTKEMPRCGFSAATIEILSRFGVEYKDVNILEDPEKWSAIKQFSDWPTIPQVYIGGEFVGGCDIVREMDAKGELEPLVQKALAG
ncbi:MAG: Grx4 family monothiol glutaredoxin [Acidobacteriota bacterium]